MGVGWGVEAYTAIFIWRKSSYQRNFEQKNLYWSRKILPWTVNTYFLCFCTVSESILFVYLCCVISCLKHNFFTDFFYFRLLDHYMTLTGDSIHNPDLKLCIFSTKRGPDSKFLVAHMGSTWVLSAPDGPHVDPMNLAIRGCILDHF